MAVSTRYPRTRDEARQPAVAGYPPPAQVAGVLLNAIFLDLLDSDATRLQQLNGLLDRLPPGSRNGFQHIDLLVLRPSQDLGRLANEFEANLPRTFRFLVRGLGSRETRSNDLLSPSCFNAITSRSSSSSEKPTHGGDRRRSTPFLNSIKRDVPYGANTIART
jgi:NTE family protein